MLKAAAGGGGKGMRLVATAAELDAAAERARGEARSAFGDDSVYLEKAIVRPRHVEIQVMADAHGGAVHLFERECSIQRRHQKVIEESPSPAVTPELRERMGALALALVKRAGYVNAGTLEFLVDAERNPYFLEMNTRLQVEHPVTEMVTGVDIVKLQIRVAAGERLPVAQGDLRQSGHAIECRVYAEDPDNSFLPSPGIVQGLRVPGGPGIRDDSGVYEGATVSIHYDPMVSKLVAHGADRDEAIRRMRRAVAEYTVLGIKTTLPFFARVLRHPAFVSGDYDTSFIETAFKDAPEAGERPWHVALAAAALQAHRERQKAVHGAESGPGGKSSWRASTWRPAGDRWP
jgi:acetyl-CoA carboxylase biotin carboxylase subunit